MLRKIYCEIISDYNWKEIVQMLCCLIAIPAIGGSTMPNNWVVGCLVLCSIITSKTFESKRKRITNVFFYIPDQYYRNKYMKCWFFAISSLLLMIMLLAMLVRYLEIVNLMEMKIAGSYIGNNPILEVMQLLLAIDFCLIHTGNICLDDVIGSENKVYIWAVLLQGVDMVVMICLGISIQNDGKNSDMRNLWSEGFYHALCNGGTDGIGMRYIVYFTFTFIITIFTIYLVKSSLKIMNELEAH